MVRPAEELAVARVLIQMQLHPGNAETAQHIVVDPAAIAAVVAAAIDLDKRLWEILDYASFLTL